MLFIYSTTSVNAPSTFESRLWKAANIFRGRSMRLTSRSIFFRYFFFKRICDVWDDEYQEIVDDIGGEQLAWFLESHRFQIPADCYWNDVRSNSANVGATLRDAMREVEKAAPELLYGVLGNA